MPDQTPEPDQFGRYRVTNKDTGHRETIRAAELPHGNYTVLQEPASDPLSGDPLPPEYGNTRPLSNPTTSGQSADVKKEKADG